MPGLANCRSLLRSLISTRDPNAVPLAESAIDDCLEVTPERARTIVLRVLRQDALDQHGPAAGVQRDAYIERKLAEK
jgi:hypothetical protein